MRSRIAIPLMSVLALACANSSHPTRPSTLATPSTSAAMKVLIDRPGPLKVETINSADWAVARSGLINLDHPRAKEAGMEEGDEPIQIFFHVIRHPTHGTFIIDTGVERALRDDPPRAAIRGFIARLMKAENMNIRVPLGDWLSKEKDPLAGIFLTHLHLDHVSGLQDAPKETPLFSGPGESASRLFLHAFVRGSIDRALDGFGPVNEWGFNAHHDVVDVFRDGSLWAIWVPGHTPGSTAFLARTETGPVLFVGDASHTDWGWEHGVEPGTFTQDGPRSVESFARLQQLAREHPAMQVRLGHQERGAAQAAR